MIYLAGSAVFFLALIAGGTITLAKKMTNISHGLGFTDELEARRANLEAELAAINRKQATARQAATRQPKAAQANP